MELFEKLGVPLKTERGRRVFPVSDRALDIADALQLFIKNKNIEVEQGRARRLVFEDGVLKGVLTENGDFYRAQKVIISTGGLSYSATGSSGDGYELANRRDTPSFRQGLLWLEFTPPKTFRKLRGFLLKT